MSVETAPHERDYLERTIATVRNHRDLDNCWPQWANIFADEIERLWAAGAAAERDRAALDAIATVLNGYRPYRVMVEEITAILANAGAARG